MKFWLATGTQCLHSHYTRQIRPRSRLTNRHCEVRERAIVIFPGTPDASRKSTVKRFSLSLKSCSSPNMASTGRWVPFSSLECRRINDLLFQQHLTREKSHQHYLEHYNPLAKSVPRKSYEPLFPVAVLDLTTNSYYQCPTDDWWQQADENRFRLLFWLTPEKERQVSQVLQQAAQKRERAKARYAETHPYRRAHCPSLQL